MGRRTPLPDLDILAKSRLVLITTNDKEETIDTIGAISA
jgi:hypothetical protein